MRLKFWIKTALQISCIPVIAAPLYMLLKILQDPAYTKEMAYLNGSIFLWLFTGIVGLVMSVNLYSQHLNLALSFGSTRREALWGIFFYRLICPAVTAVAYLLLHLLLGRNSPSMNLPMYLGFSLFLGATGSLLAIIWNEWDKTIYWLLMFPLLLFTGFAYSDFPDMLLVLFLGFTLLLGFMGFLVAAVWKRWDKKAYWLMIPFVLLACATFAGLIVVMILGEQWLSSALPGSSLGWIVLVVGIIAHFLCMIPERKAIYQFQVKL